jgi:hypothetical protein
LKSNGGLYKNKSKLQEQKPPLPEKIFGSNESEFKRIYHKKKTRNDLPSKFVSGEGSLQSTNYDQFVLFDTDQSNADDVTCSKTPQEAPHGFYKGEFDRGKAKMFRSNSSNLFASMIQI